MLDRLEDLKISWQPRTRKKLKCPCSLTSGVMATLKKDILSTFVVLWIAWTLFTVSLDPQEVAVGAALSICIAYAVSKLSRGFSLRWLSPHRLAHAVRYVFLYVWAEIRAHIKVIWLILHPSMPIKPGIVRIPTSLRTDVGITALANSITMTPGTLSVDVRAGESALYVHWIDVETTDPQGARERIAGSLEKYLVEVFG